MFQTAFDLDDATLAAAVRYGDPDAFDTLFRRHYGTVRRMCTRRMGSATAGDEIAQVAFMRAYERLRLGHRGGVVGRKGHRFGPWVQGIAFELCLEAQPAEAVQVAASEASRVLSEATETLVEARRRTIECSNLLGRS